MCGCVFVCCEVVLCVVYESVVVCDYVCVELLFGGG